MLANDSPTLQQAIKFTGNTHADASGLSRAIYHRCGVSKYCAGPGYLHRSSCAAKELTPLR